MSDTGIRISGGGSIGVDTAAMRPAMLLLADAGDRFGQVAARADLLRWSSIVPAITPGLESAAALARAAAGRAERTGTALHTAAVRYGLVEDEALRQQRTLAAGIGAAAGTTLTAATLLGGPIAAAAAIGAGVDMAVLAVVLRSIEQLVATGRIDPQSDPALILAVALLISSLDDAARGAMLRETPEDLRSDDPASPFGTEWIAALIAAAVLQRAGGALAVTPTERGRTRSPGGLAALMDRIPFGEEPGGQVRIERYDGPGGAHWIVYISGTVTFSPFSGKEPFDMASNVLGVAHRRSDSEQAVLDAMAQAGIGRDEPVLLVGHSQGALNAVRVAQDGGYDVGGVVQFGGPTGQIDLGPDVPVLSVEHDQDLVPALGGGAAAAAGGLDRLVVHRSLQGLGAGKLVTTDFPAHDRETYKATLAAAERGDDPRIAAMRSRLAPFLDAGTGTTTRYHAERVDRQPAVSPARGRTAVAG